MLKGVLLLIILSACMACHKTESRPGCASQVCTLEFRSIYVKFVNQQGQPVAIENFKVVNLRTGKAIKSAGLIDAVASPGSYTVINDASIAEVSETGDDLQVTATKSGTNQTVNGSFKVSGGECSCHISKISGPSQLVFPD